MEFKLPQRKEYSNKGTYGRVLNIAGSDYMSGAAYLSSVSALKIGCGYCFLCSTEKCIDAVAAQTQNLVFLPYENLKDSIKNADVIEIGCGLSQSNDALKIFKETILNAPNSTPMIIDADGLNILAKNYELFKSRIFEQVILTPHPKEAARLLDVTLDDILSDIEKYAKTISEKYNCVTVLKTHNTVVSSPKGLYRNTTGNNALAKAGSGDVLAGMISGLVAQGTDIYEAACLGVYLHGVCGDIKAKELTQYCVMASDLIEAIPKALMTIEREKTKKEIGK